MSNFKDLVIEGRKVRTYHKNIFNSSYVVFKEKIWRIVSKSGQGNSHTIGLERELANEKTTIKGRDFEDVQFVIPQGHISI